MSAWSGCLARAASARGSRERMQAFCAALMLILCSAIPGSAQSMQSHEGASASIVYVEVTRGQDTYCASGFVFHRSGLIATCYHVVELADGVRVRSASGTWYTAKVVGTDGINDLAVLQIDSTRLPPLKLGLAAHLSYGQDVIAYGYPLCGSWLGQDVVATRGEITAVRGTGEGQAYQLRLDAMPGNSGGPLLNDAGEVIGVLFLAVNPVKVFLLTGWLPAEPISFAVPVWRLEEITPGPARLDVFSRNASSSAYPTVGSGVTGAPASSVVAPAGQPSKFWHYFWPTLGVLWLIGLVGALVTGAFWE